MKTFTQRVIDARNFAQSEDYNQEAGPVTATFSGGLQGQQLPYDSVDETVVSLGENLDSVCYTTTGGIANGIAQRKATQTYAITQTLINDFEGFDPPTGGPALTGILGPPSYTYATNSSGWGPGWNRYSDVIADGVFLSLPMRRGMLKGCAIVDFEFYLGDLDAYGLSGLAGGDWRWQIGVFVDGVLTAKTGEMPCRRTTVVLPFATPVPGRRVEVDVRWKANYDGAGQSNSYSYVADTVLRSFNHTLWIRNQAK